MGEITFTIVNSCTEGASQKFLPLERARKTGRIVLATRRSRTSYKIYAVSSLCVLHDCDLNKLIRLLEISSKWILLTTLLPKCPLTRSQQEPRQLRTKPLDSQINRFICLRAYPHVRFDRCIKKQSHEVLILKYVLVKYSMNM
jgi:hypothetical protein